MRALVKNQLQRQPSDRGDQESGRVAEASVVPIDRVRIPRAGAAEQAGRRVAPVVAAGRRGECRVRLQAGPGAESPAAVPWTAAVPVRVVERDVGLHRAAQEGQAGNRQPALAEGAAASFEPNGSRSVRHPGAFVFQRLRNGEAARHERQHGRPRERVRQGPEERPWRRHHGVLFQAAHVQLASRRVPGAAVSRRLVRRRRVHEPTAANFLRRGHPGTGHEHARLKGPDKDHTTVVRPKSH